MRGGGADTGGRRGRKEGRLAGAQPARKGAVQVTADPPTEADYHEVSQTFSDNACVLTCVRVCAHLCGTLWDSTDNDKDCTF